jgi:hypothetical protein
MPDRSLIFNAKGAQIGYIEGDRVFDLAGRERCNYAPATGNLSELNGKRIVGYVSLDGTFVGLSWISDQLFGIPSGEVHPDRALAGNRPHLRPKKPNIQRPEKSGVLEPKDVSEHATAPQAENVVEHTPAVSKSGGDPEIGLNTSKIADEVPLPKRELIVDEPDPSTDDELFGRAIGMIRSALGKGSE